MKLLLLVTSSCFSFNAYSQNAYDYSNTVRFGDYLYNTQQFGLAAQEYERAYFLLPSDTILNFKLFKTYIKLNHTSLAKKTYYSLNGDSSLIFMPNHYADLYVKSLIKNESYKSSFDFINNCNYLTKKHEYLTASLLLTNDWVGAQTSSKMIQVSNGKVNPLLTIVGKTESLKRKKPIVGVFLSAIIPGAGKLYAGEWEDALIDFVTTTSSGVLAVRAINKYNTNSPYVWFLCTAAVGYYSGNLYGSYHSVQHYNERNIDLIKNETKNYIDNW